MTKQKGGYVKREGYFPVSKGGEPVTFIDTEVRHTINIEFAKLSKETIEEIRKHIKNAICGHFPIKKKLRDEDVWSVS